MGGSNSSYYIGDLNYNALTQETYWQIAMTSVNVGTSIALCSGGCETIVDTGAILINGPTNEIAKLNEFLGFDATDGSIDCAMRNTLPSN